MSGIIKPGLVSVTFRSRIIEEIVLLCADTGLSVIEWGGDVHVPHGDTDAAELAHDLCHDAGIELGDYASYYNLPADGAGFEDTVITAAALEAPGIRIWAGSAGSGETAPELRDKMTERLRRNAAAAASAGLSLSFEYHGGTLTDNAESACRLLKECGADNVFLHWQPNQFRDFEYNLAALRRVAPYVDCAHVFAWEGDKKLPLSAHGEMWREYFDILGKSGRCRSALLEFLPCEDEDNLRRDSETLRGILGV